MSGAGDFSTLTLRIPPLLGHWSALAVVHRPQGVAKTFRYSLRCQDVGDHRELRGFGQMGWDKMKLIDLEALGDILDDVYLGIWI